MSSSPYPIGSGVFSIFAFLTVCLIVLLILRHYLPIRRSPAFLVVPVFLALALPASLVLLVPIDLASSIGHSKSAIWQPSRVLLVSWRIDYWLIFVLTWYVICIEQPIQANKKLHPESLLTHSAHSSLTGSSCPSLANGLIPVIVPLPPALETPSDPMPSISSSFSVPP